MASERSRERTDRGDESDGARRSRRVVLRAALQLESQKNKTRRATRHACRATSLASREVGCSGQTPHALDLAIEHLLPRSRAIGVEVDGGRGSRGASGHDARAVLHAHDLLRLHQARGGNHRGRTRGLNRRHQREDRTRASNRAHCGRREHHGGDLVDVVVAGETRAAGLGKSEPAVAASPAGGCARAANGAKLSSAARRDAQAHGGERTGGCLRHRGRRVEGGRARGTMRGPLFGRCAFSGREEKSRELAGKKSQRRFPNLSVCYSKEIFGRRKIVSLARPVERSDAPFPSVGRSRGHAFRFDRSAPVERSARIT